jgi:two-component system sensor histidine kinase/response regulator
MTGLSLQFPIAVKQRWRSLIGSPSEFALEARIFHSITLGIAVLLLPYMPYNLFAGLYFASFTCIIFSGMFFYEYYRSRYLLRPHRCVVFGISGLLLLSVNYFANSGILGSTDLIWPVYLLLLLTICPYKHMVTWVLIYLAVFSLVHVAEIQYPQLVQYPFHSGNGQLTDRITAFPIPVISIAIIIGLLRKNYDKERIIVAQRDAEKGRLLSILSHDLRTPFIQLQQYFELLNNNELSESERAHFERVLKHSNDQTLDMVTNLLYWSRSQLEGFTMHLTILPLQETLRNTLDLALRTCSEKGIVLTTAIHPEIRVLADADMLQLVVRNLLQNAVKFTTSGGNISVETETISKNCRITVSDTGTGISPEQLNSIFSGAIPAFGTANEKGVGLGLQLCKEFMERQGGSIHVESDYGKGSRFIIYIPLA